MLQCCSVAGSAPSRWSDLVERARPPACTTTTVHFTGDRADLQTRSRDLVLPPHPPILSATCKQHSGWRETRLPDYDKPDCCAGSGLARARSCREEERATRLANLPRPPVLELLLLAGVSTGLSCGSTLQSHQTRPWCTVKCSITFSQLF